MSTEPIKTRAGEIFFVAVFFIFSAFLLSQLGEQAKFNPKGKFFSPASGLAWHWCHWHDAVWRFAPADAI